MKEIEEQRKIEEMQVKNMRDRQDHVRQIGSLKETKLREMNHIGEKIRRERDLFTKMKYKIHESEAQRKFARAS